ncbi:MFS transporter [Solibacillus sp. NPDC093137]|uniref:MFS transporter n=1 Tax=Solibacillus sp. NPDC093137 TaxID=3390678 RepID=UPI003D035596
MKALKYKGLVSFLLIFYLSMGISRYVQILWFEKNDAVFAYSLSYAFMAIAGSLSFLLGSKINGQKLLKSFAFFIPIYSLGMLLRIFPSPIALPILSGFISGIGASTVILIVRTWIFVIANEQDEDKEFLISSRVVAGQIGAVLSVLLAGQLLVIFQESEYIYIILLLASSLSLYTVFLVKIPDNKINEKRSTILPTDKKLTLIAVISSVILGTSNGMFEPYLPIILKNIGFSLSTVSIIMAVYATIKIISGLTFQNKKLLTYPHYNILVAEILLCFSAIGLVMLNQKYLILPLIFIISVLISVTNISIEIWEYRVFPSHELPIYFGIIHSSFFIGDALGGTVGGYLYTYVNIEMLFIVFSILSLILGTIYFTMYKKIQFAK